MYDPRIGKWLTDDPSDFDGGDYNLSRYVGNDPVNKVDPSGLKEEEPKRTLPAKDAPFLKDVHPEVVKAFYFQKSYTIPAVWREAMQQAMRRMGKEKIEHGASLFSDKAGKLLAQDAEPGKTAATIPNDPISH